MSSVLAELQWATALVAQAMLAWLGTPMSWQGDQLAHASGFVAQVHRDCTAWWPSWGLLIGLAVLGAPARVPARRLLCGAAAGVCVMVLVNQLRLVAVLWTGVHVPGLLGWMHEVVGPLMLVAAGAAVVARTVWQPVGSGAATATGEDRHPGTVGHAMPPAAAV